MKIYLPAIEVGDKEGFTTEKDLFGRAELGKGMTNLVSTISDPLVIAFDGEWGTGKTTFLKMWAGELRKKDFPVIYFDTFENDYADDAFAVLVREVIALVEASESEKKLVENFKDQSIKLGSLLLGSAAKIGIRSALQLLTVGLAKETDIEDLINKASDGSDDYMRSFLSEPQKQKDVATQFRKTLESLPALLAPPENEETQKPLVFIIDELDRCKPLFALQLLERIKHFMSVPNVHFVLGVHLEQLKRSVQFAYGAEIDATSYLQKFINLTIANTDGARQPHEQYIEHLITRLELPEIDEMPFTQYFVERVALSNGYSLRVLERIVTNIALAVAFAEKNEFFFAPLVAGLCILKVVKPELFLKAKKGQLKYAEVSEIFAFDSLSSDEDDREGERQRKFWECALKNDETSSIWKEYFRYHFNSPKEILPSVANNIVDRLKSN